MKRLTFASFKPGRKETKFLSPHTQIFLTLQRFSDQGCESFYGRDYLRLQVPGVWLKITARNSREKKPQPSILMGAGSAHNAQYFFRVIIQLHKSGNRENLL